MRRCAVGGQCLAWCVLVTVFNPGNLLRAQDKPQVPDMTVQEAISALKSPRALIQRQGTMALYEMGAKAAPAVPTIISLLEADGPEVRPEMLHLLRSIGPASKAAAPLVIPYLEHQNFHVRYLSCRVVGTMGTAAKPAVPVLLKLMHDPVTSVRRRAAEALGHLGSEVAPEGLGPLMDATKDPNHTVRELAVLALGDFGPPAKAAVPLLKGILQDEKSSVRVQAAHSLWALTKDANLVLPVLNEQLQTGDLPWEAAQVLADMGPAAKDAVPNLITALDGEPSLQVFAIEALGRIGAPAKPALPALRKLLKSDEPQIRDLAREAIRAIENGRAK